ncbi:MAG: hypothetical protein NW205_11970 [Hyphomicrobiaceae bacterium]|nr:hypothetical protein [Hyphomicrobiaceae bacterium]
MSVLSAIGRMILVVIGFALALAAAGFVVVTLGLERFTHLAHRDGGELAGIEAMTRLIEQGLVLAAGLTIVPALLAVIVGEVVRIRSATYYVVAGGVAAAAVPMLAANAAAGPASGAFWPVLATAGFAGGFMYWLVAGRSA